MADEALAAFMDATGCGYDDAFHRLASCGGHLGKAVNRFFNVDAGTSGSRRSPPPPQVISSDSESEDDDDDDDDDFAPRAPAPAARHPARGGAGARGRSPPGSAAPRRVSRWDSEAKGGGSGSSKSSRRRRRRREMLASRKHDDRVEKKKRRRVGEDDGPSRGGGNGAGGDRKSSRRRRRFCEVFVSSSDGEEEEEVKANKNRRRRLDPKDDASDGDEVQIVSSSSSGRPNHGDKAPTFCAPAVVKRDGGGSSSSGLPNRGGKAPTSGTAAVVNKEGSNGSSGGLPNRGSKAPTSGAPATVKKDGGSGSSGLPNRGGKAPTSGAPAVVKKEGGNGSSGGFPNCGGKAPTSGAPAAVTKEGGNSSNLLLRHILGSSSDNMKVYKAPPPLPPRASKSEKDKLFRVPHGLTYKGGGGDGGSNGLPNRDGKAPTSGAPAAVKKDGGGGSSGLPNRGGKAPTSGAPAVVKKEGGNGSSGGLPNRGGKAPTSGAPAAVTKEGDNRSNLLLRHILVSSSSNMKVYKAPPPPPPPRASKSEKDKLFRVPHGLTYKGGFHDAVAHAARRRQWLLVNVQGLDLASLAQNRDVWASDLVAQCVGEHFVLWQADAGDGDEERGAGDGEGEEAKKVLSYYKVPRDKVPVIIIVDPVTGQAVGRLHGTDPNDFLVSMGPYTEKRPAFPVVGAAKKSSAAPTSRQEQAPTTVRKPAEQPVATTAVAVAQQPASVEKAAVCKMRVRLPDGRVVAKDFGSQCAVAELFAYCRSEMGAGAAAARPFRLLRFVGAARVEIENDNASFESLKLHMSTVCVDLR